MSYIRDLRYKLQVKRNNVLKADYNIFNHQLALFFEFLNKYKLFKSILREIKYDKGDVDSWIENLEKKREAAVPNSEKEKIALCYGILRHCLEDKDKAWNIGHIIDMATGVNESLDTFKNYFFEPFYEYIDASTDEGNSVLYLIERFKLRSEWFDRKRLYELYKSDTTKGEENLRVELIKYLFDQGIDYPFIDLQIPSGLADIAAELDKENALVTEVKLFEPDKGYGRSYIRKGFRQAYDYTNDFNKPYGYYVIFNLSDKDLQFKMSSDKQGAFPIRIEIGDKIIFITIINIFQFSEPSSKRGKLEPYIIEENYLTSLEGEDLEK